MVVFRNESIQHELPHSGCAVVIESDNEEYGNLDERRPEHGTTFSCACL